MSPIPPTPPRASWRLPALLCALVLAVYWPALTFDFVRWDDETHIYRNPHYQQFGLSDAAYFWRSPYNDIYMPATYTLWGALSRVARTPAGGLHPSVFHACNLLLHAIATLLVYAILQRLRFAPAPSALGAALFAIHPTQVEPVAWATGLKDVLGGALALAALYHWLRAADHRDGGHANKARTPYTRATLFFVLAMLSKPTTLCLPLVIAPIEWALRRDHPRRTLIPLAIWIALAAALALAARTAQPPGTVPEVPLWFRPVVALDALAFYLAKLFLPWRLTIDYGRSPHWLLASPERLWTWLIPLSTLALASLLSTTRQTRWPLAAFATLVASLLPVLGLATFDFQLYSTVADRYLYLALLAPALLLAATMHHFAHPASQDHARTNDPQRATRADITTSVILSLRRTLLRRSNDSHPPQDPSQAQEDLERLASPQTLAAKSALIISLLAIACLAARSFTQIWTWQDSRALFTHALRINPDSPAANNGLGILLANEARTNPARAALFDDALRHFRRALTTAPTHRASRTNLATTLLLLDQRQEAIDTYRQALRLDPAWTEARQALASLERATNPAAISPARN